MTIIEVCADALAKYKGVEVKATPARIAVTAGDARFRVSLVDAGIENDERGKGGRLTDEKFQKAPTKIVDHYDVLNACLYALARSEHCDRVSDLTVDGDGKDCEAIFTHVAMGDCSLRVR